MMIGVRVDLIFSCMEKMYRLEKLDIDWSEDESIEDIKAKIATLEASGFTHIFFEAEER